ncbi:MAG: hypothetical protein WC699_14960 [Bacteroidales bacterium]
MNKEDQDLTDAQLLRRKAEAHLRKAQEKADHSAAEPDVKKLVHELQVHQIELEMQNEEIQQAYKTAEEALKKYTLLYDLAPMGYFTLDKDSNIMELNFTGAELLGERRFSLVNSNFRLFIDEESLPTFNIFFDKVYSSHKKESCLLTLGYDKKALDFVYIEGVVIEEEEKCLLSMVSISRLSTATK